MIFCMLCFTLFLGFMFFLMAVVLAYFMPLMYSKSSAFECGFQPFLSSGYVFSMPFFVVCLMFLLFDVEIVIICFPSFLNLSFYFGFWFVIFLIFLATCYEWKGGVLKWV